MALPQGGLNPVDSGTDIGTAPPWMRPKPMRTLPAANDFDSQLASVQGNALGRLPTSVDPGRGGGAMPADWTPNANVQQMFPGMGSGGPAGPVSPTAAASPGAFMGGGSLDMLAQRGMGGGVRPPGASINDAGFKGIVDDPAPNAGGASMPGDDLHQNLSANYDAIMGRGGAPLSVGTQTMEAGASAPAPAAPKMAAASTAPAPQMEAGGTAASTPAEDPFLAAIRNNTGPGAKPPWMVQRDADLLAEATGKPPETAAAPGAPAAAAAAPGAAAAPALPSMSGIFRSTPGVDVGGQTPWAGADPIAMTRVNASGLPDLDTDFAGAAQKGADAAYKGATQFFDEDFKRDRSDMESKLINQGFAPGTEGFDRELGLMLRSQNAARENAGFAAQGVGHAQAGDLLQRALASRSALMGERERDADRTHAQTVDVANLGLGARAQDKGIDQAGINAAGASAGAGASLAASKYTTDANTNIALRQLGLSQDAQGFNQLMQLVASSRGGVNMPNFGSPAPLDVTGANQIASSNSNSAANRDATDRAALYNLGGAALGSIFR